MTLAALLLCLPARPVSLSSLPLSRASRNSYCSGDDFVPHLQVLAMSVDEGILATGCDDGKVRIWSLTSYQYTYSLLSNSYCIYALHLRNGVLFSSGDSGEVDVWRVDEDGQSVASLHRSILTHAGSVLATATTPLGQLLTLSTYKTGPGDLLSVHVPRAAGDDAK